MIAAAQRKEAAARAEAERKAEALKREHVEKELLRQQKQLQIKREAGLKERVRGGGEGERCYRGAGASPSLPPPLFQRSAKVRSLRA